MLQELLIAQRVNLGCCELYKMANDFCEVQVLLVEGVSLELLRIPLCRKYTIARFCKKVLSVLST